MSEQLLSVEIRTIVVLVAASRKSVQSSLECSFATHCTLCTHSLGGSIILVACRLINVFMHDAQRSFVVIWKSEEPRGNRKEVGCYRLILMMMRRKKMKMKTIVNYLQFQ